MYKLRHDRRHKTSREPSQCPLTPLGWVVEADSGVCDGSGGNGGEGIGVVGRLVVLVPFVGESTGWGDDTGRGDAGRG